MFRFKRGTRPIGSLPISFSEFNAEKIRTACDRKRRSTLQRSSENADERLSAVTFIPIITVTRIYDETFV